MSFASILQNNFSLISLTPDASGGDSLFLQVGASKTHMPARECALASLFQRGQRRARNVDAPVSRMAAHGRAGISLGTGLGAVAR